MKQKSLLIMVVLITVAACCLAQKVGVYDSFGAGGIWRHCALYTD